jgi:hypothetical protein
LIINTIHFSGMQAFAW